MKWSDSIPFRQPLREVRLLVQAPAQGWNEFLRDREQAAYQRGQQDGEKALTRQLLQHQGETGELQNGVLQSLARAIPQVVRETENALIQLALDAAQKIVAGLPINAEMIEAVVTEAVRQVEGSAEITVQLHPEDFKLLRLHQSAVLTGLPDSGPLHFTGSAAVTRGGCLVQTRFGVIDARRETKLEQLRQTLSA
ncbi:MAG TPA: FliH/SctL family protein [Verrucomicrobiae bacterium]